MDTDRFFDVYRKAGTPGQIIWHPDGREIAWYAIGFTQPIKPDGVNILREYVGRHNDTLGAWLDPGNSRGMIAQSVIVACKHPDNDYRFLTWLQERFTPYRRYSGIAHLVRPLVVHIRVIGMLPNADDYNYMVEAFTQHTGVTTASHNSMTRTIAVGFAAPPTEAAIAEITALLNAQRFIGVTVQPGALTLPQRAPRESETE